MEVAGAGLRLLFFCASVARQAGRGRRRQLSLLAESIRMHPDQETLKAMMEQAGLSRVEYFNLTGGVVALHRGFKL